MSTKTTISALSSFILPKDGATNVYLCSCEVFELEGIFKEGLCTCGQAVAVIYFKCCDVCFVTYFSEIFIYLSARTCA